MDGADFKKWLMWNAGGGAAIIAVLGIFLLLIGNDISGRASDIKSQRQNLASRLQALNSLVSLRQGSDQAAAILPKLQNSLPTSDQLIGFSKFLQSIATANQLTFNFSFTDQVAATANTPSTNNFLMTLSGPYANFLKFLQAAESSQYYVGFDSFDVTARGAVSDIIVKGKVFAQ